MTITYRGTAYTVRTEAELITLVAILTQKRAA
jgi:hypothetical protein